METDFFVKTLKGEPERVDTVPAFPGVPTRKGEKTRLEGKGLQGPALTMMVSAGGCDRHAARVKAAMVAALRAAIGATPDGEEEVAILTDGDDDGEETIFTIMARAWGLAYIEAHLGVGTRGGYPADGGCTARMPFAWFLGKGRKQAADGPAWTAAIRGAAERLKRWLLESHPEGWSAQIVLVPYGHQVAVRVDFLKNPTFRKVLEPIANGEESPEVIAEPCEVVLDLTPSWAAAVAAHALRHLAEGSEPSLSMGGGLEEWAAVYNRAYEALPPATPRW